MKTIKAIMTKDYAISLVENQEDLYQIEYGSSEKTSISESIKDLGIASMLFDIKLNDLQGASNH